MSATTEDRVGKVSRARYEELVADGLEQLALAGAAQLRLGDNALEIAPMNRHGWWQNGPNDEPPGTQEVLVQYAGDVDVELSTLLDHRWVASRWPKGQRRDGIGYSVYKVLAGVQDEQERFKTLAEPPFHERSRRHRWTLDAAKRKVGQRAGRPETVQEKVNRVHDLVADEQVAVQVASDLLRRPAVVADVVADETAMHVVNTAQADRSRAAAARREEEAPPETREAVKKARAWIEHTGEYVDLVGACAAFVAAAGRIVPTLGEHPFTEDEQATVHTNLDKVKAAVEWIEAAVDTGRLTLSEGLAALLRGQ
jgi:hypothetical protein